MAADGEREPFDVNVRQAAEILGVHENTVRNWAKAGRLPSEQLPGSGFHRFQRSVLVAIRKAMDEGPSYHDLHITTDEIPRTSIFNLPYGIEVSCTRVAGWEVRDHNQMVPPPPRLSNLSPDPKLLGGEYNAEPEDNEEGRPVRGGLRLDVAGFVIVDSLTPEPEPAPSYRLGDVADIVFTGGKRRATYIPNYSYAGESAWVWAEGHCAASHVRDVQLVERGGST